jgi:hypothetical protein
MQPFHPHRTEGKEWCGQCERLQAAPSVRACRSQFCKLKPLLPPADEIGFKESPQPVRAPVDVAPQIIARVERAREPEREPVMVAPGPKMNRKRDENGLTPKTRLLLTEMQKRVGPDGTVTVSFNDLFEAIGCTTPSTVSPLMQCLIERRYISIVDRRGGRAKTRYLVHGLTQDRVLELPRGGPVEQVADADPSILRARMPANPEKSPTEACGGCRFAHLIGVGSMVCRRLPPDARKGHPPIKPADWCGEFQRSA